MTAPCRLSRLLIILISCTASFCVPLRISHTWVRRPSLRRSDTSRHPRPSPCRDNAHGKTQYTKQHGGLSCGDEQTAASLTVSNPSARRKLLQEQLPTNELTKDIILANTVFLDITLRPISYLRHTTFRTLDSVSFFT